VPERPLSEVDLAVEVALFYDRYQAYRTWGMGGQATWG
jgi:hypothetical protein